MAIDMHKIKYFERKNNFKMKYFFSISEKGRVFTFNVSIHNSNYYSATNIKAKR